MEEQKAKEKRVELMKIIDLDSDCFIVHNQTSKSKNFNDSYYAFQNQV